MYSGNAILDCLRRVLDAPQDGGAKQAAAPRRQRKASEPIAREAAGLPVVRGVERRSWDKAVYGQDGDPGGGQPPCDLFVRRLIVAVLDVEVELALCGILGIGNDLLAVLGIVVEHQIDRQTTCTEHASSNADVSAGKAQPLDPRAGIIGEVRRTRS